MLYLGLVWMDFFYKKKSSFYVCFTNKLKKFNMKIWKILDLCKKIPYVIIKKTFIWGSRLYLKTLTKINYCKYLFSLDNSLLPITENTLPLILLDRCHILIASQIHYCDSLKTNLGATRGSQRALQNKLHENEPHMGVYTHPRRFIRFSQVPWRFIILDLYFPFYFSYQNRSYHSFMIGRCLP